MSKKIILIIGILVIIGIAAFLIFSSTTEEGGETRVGFSLREFLPFGKSEETTQGQSPATNNQATEIPRTDPNAKVPRLRKISSEPVAGATIFITGATSTVRFVEKGTGNVYEVKSDSLDKKRLTNTTIPKIIRALWLPNGEGFLAQTLFPESEVVETNFVKLNKNTATSSTESLTPFQISKSQLPTGIKEISIKPDSSKIFYYVLVSGGSKWYTANPDGTVSNLLMSHPLSEWLPKWVGNTIIMQAKASVRSIGYTYSYDIGSKIFKKIGPGAIGQTVTPNKDGTSSIVSTGGLNPQIFLYDYINNASKNIGSNTLSEKCIWLNKESSFVYCAVPNEFPNGEYPDSWYKGLVNTEDYLKKINLKDDIYYNTANLSSLSGEKIDVVDLMISPDDSHIIFRNKVDGYLWMLRLEE